MNPHEIPMIPCKLAKKIPESPKKNIKNYKIPAKNQQNPINITIKSENPHKIRINRGALRTRRGRRLVLRRPHPAALHVARERLAQGRVVVPVEHHGGLAAGFTSWHGGHGVMGLQMGS